MDLISDLIIVVKHYGFPINNWGYEVINEKTNEVLFQDMTTGDNYITENISVFDKAKKKLIQLQNERYGITES